MGRFVVFLLAVGLFISCKDSDRKKSIELNNKGIALWLKSNSNSPESKIYADSSLMLLSESIRTDSSNRGAYWNKLAFEMGLRRLHEAKRTANIYFRKFHDPRSLFSLGSINFQLGDSLEGKRNFNKALKLYQSMIRESNINEDSILFDLVLAYHLNDDDVKAEELYNKYRKTRIGSKTFEKVDFDSLISIFRMQERALAKQ